MQPRNLRIKIPFFTPAPNWRPPERGQNTEESTLSANRMLCENVPSQAVGECCILSAPQSATKQSHGPSFRKHPPIDEALAQFDREERASPKWQGWETRESYKYAIAKNGRLYPPKEIVVLATKIRPRTLAAALKPKRLFAQARLSDRSLEASH